MHEVRIGRSAAKEFESLPDQVIDRVAAKIDSLSTLSRPAGCKKLRGGDDLWRVESVTSGSFTRSTTRS